MKKAAELTAIDEMMRAKQNAPEPDHRAELRRLQEERASGSELLKRCTELNGRLMLARCDLITLLAVIEIIRNRYGLDKETNAIIDSAIAAVETRSRLT